MSTKFKPASPEELAARGVLPAEPEVAEAAPADAKPKVAPKPKGSKK